MCIAIGGTITGEHGVGLEKLAFMPILFSPVDLDVMYALRHAFDAQAIANRGKKLPGDAPALASHAPHPLEAAGVISRM
jgi:glycolate oxidase